MIYDKLALTRSLARFTRSVCPSVRPSTALSRLPSASPPARLQDSRPGPVGLCDACSRRNNAPCRKFIAFGVEMKIERALTDRPGRPTLETPPPPTRRSFAAATDRLPRRARDPGLPGGDTTAARRRQNNASAPPSQRAAGQSQPGREPRRRGRVRRRLAAANITTSQSTKDGRATTI